MVHHDPRHCPASFHTDGNNPRVVGAIGHQPVESVGFNTRIGVDHENVLVEGGVDSDDVLHLVVDLEFERETWEHQK